MKKDYMSPSVEVVKFQYRDQVVAASGEKCINKYVNTGDNECDKQEWQENFAD